MKLGTLAVVCLLSLSGALSASAEALPVVENGGTYINGLVAAGETGAEVVLPKGRYVLDVPVVLNTDSKPVAIRGATGNPRDVVLDGDGTTNNVAITGWRKSRLLASVTVTNVCWVNDAAVDFGHGGVTCRDAIVSNCVVTGCRTEASAGWNCGGGVYCSSGRFIGTTIEHCALKVTSSSAKTASGGGIYLTGGHLLNCRILSNVCTSTVNMAIAYGGGVYADGSSTMTNCLVKGNCGFHVGGGVYASSTDIYATSIVGNWLVFSSWGGGLSGSNVHLTKCRIEGNRSAKNCGGMDANGAFYLNDCLFRWNWVKSGSTAGGLHVRGGGTEGVISNCVFEANTNTSYTSAIHIAGAPAALLLRDCLVLENVGLYTCVSVSEETSSLTVQNCLFARNSYGSYDFLYNVLPPYRTLVENCSFLDETTSNGRCIDLCPNWFDEDKRRSLVESLFVRNTCIAGNSSGKDYPTYFNTYAITNCTYCYDQNGTQIPGGAAAHNVTGTLDDLQFKDYANGNYAIGRKSILKDAGLKADWMGSGSKKGAKDLGDGSYVAETVMDYGVAIRHPNAHPRAAGNSVDIGAAEFYQKPGLLTYVK